jgi:hypothetical protein
MEADRINDDRLAGKRLPLSVVERWNGCEVGQELANNNRTVHFDAIEFEWNEHTPVTFNGQI